ncbi:hypothetical protein HHK36_003183 [Tetracentron sinense]|uniref:Uncharacterized protein n=1 Tax=Tetracentron sinense TaxID=13715 RepID=A0A834ZNV2_TETSI|nr:hypothetical protein HHK36_003183 [Tetracentron sinense]
MDLTQKKIEGLLREESIVNLYGIRVYFVGNLKLLNKLVRLAAEEKAMAATAKTKAVLLICIAYTSTNEESYEEKCGDLNSSGACNGLIGGVGGTNIKLVDLEKHMYMAVSPDPDILIRSSWRDPAE